MNIKRTFLSAILIGIPLLFSGGIVSAVTSNLGLSQLAVSLSVGQSLNISASGGYILSIANNSSPSVALATLVSNNDILLNAYQNGSTNIEVCNPNNLCDTIVVTVGSVSLSLSSNNISMNAGQAQTVNITGGGGYSISSNSNPNTASAYISGNTLYVSGSGYGGANLDICQSDGQCAMLYVFVNTPSQGAPAPVLAPTLNSIDIDSDDVGNSFMGAQTTLNVRFSTTGPLMNPYLIVDGSQIPFTGTSSGPYSADYIATGNEPKPSSITIDYSDMNGNPTQMNFTVGGQAVPAAVPVSSPASSGVGDGYKFLNPLTIGASGLDVTELQKRLTAEGVYSGPITGFYGSMTEAAVEIFQTDHALTPLGNVGPQTRALLNSGV